MKMVRSYRSPMLATEGSPSQTCVHMLDRVLRSPMQFFVKTRAGSIVQRFSGDLVSHSSRCARRRQPLTYPQEIVVDCAELVGEATMTISQGKYRLYR